MIIGHRSSSNSKLMKLQAKDASNRLLLSEYQTKVDLWEAKKQKEPAVQSPPSLKALRSELAAAQQLSEHIKRDQTNLNSELLNNQKQVCKHLACLLPDHSRVRTDGILLEAGAQQQTEER